MVRPSLSRQTLAIALAGGVVHAALALWLSAAVRGQSVGARYAPELSATWAATTAVTVVGLVALGAVPLVLYVRDGLVAPAIGLAALFAWAHANSWQSLETARTTDAVPAPGLYPDALFGLLWVLPLAAVLLVGGLEHLARRRSGSPGSNGTPE